MRAGAQIYERTKLEPIEREPRNGAPGFQLTTSRGSFRARNVLVGTSGYTGAATPALRKKIIPIGSYIITTASSARRARPRTEPAQPSDLRLQELSLLLPPHPRQPHALRRARRSSRDRRHHPQSAEILRRGMIDVYPQLHNTKVEYAFWGGTLDLCFDIMPHAGQMDGMYFALGYAGHGVAMASLAGAKWRDGFGDGETDNPFTEVPFPGAPLVLTTTVSRGFCPSPAPTTKF